MRRLIFLILACSPVLLLGQSPKPSKKGADTKSRISFPIGGLGAGMFCIEQTGAISSFSINNTPELFNEPPLFAAITYHKKAKVIEGPVPARKKFGMPGAAQGVYYTTWGLPRFASTSPLSTRFPFASLELKDPEIPVKVRLTAWSPFIPTDQDNSGLPTGILEYQLTNTTKTTTKFLFSYSAKRFSGFREVEDLDKGFIFSKGDTTLAIYTDEQTAQVDRIWYKGNWVDPMTVAWKNIQEANIRERPAESGASGATIAVPVTLRPGASKTIRINLCWYSPTTTLRSTGETLEKAAPEQKTDSNYYYRPYYATRFKNINEVVDYWKNNAAQIRQKTLLFTQAFYNSTLPREVTQAVAANLSILKSPTLMRQQDGRLWAWEGAFDNIGSCPGSCTHVWNYAQALPHLFPQLERSLRETEFNENQDSTGRQSFRASLPIRKAIHTTPPAADGQLGGIMKAYRDWRISGDRQWITRLYPKLQASLDYCIANWDPKRKGTIEEPHHNTYDIEFWGSEPMANSMYLGALQAFVQISRDLNQNPARYQSYSELLSKGRSYMDRLYNGEYYHQQTQWTGLETPSPLDYAKTSLLVRYSPDDLKLLRSEGPKYQYGSGCLSDGLIGSWMSRTCGLPSPVKPSAEQSHLQSVFRYNYKPNLLQHSDTQRVTYALGSDGGVLLCTWPRGGKPKLPFTHCDEVWSGIEYEVASHLMMLGKVSEGLNIVRTLRKRYDGTARNPYDEYECGHWYARALASYAMIEALTGVRYDAVDQTLYIDSRIGDFTSFLSTATGFGNVTYKKGKATLQTAYGNIPVKKIIIKKH